MKKGLIVAVIVLFSTTAIAQENDEVRVKEVGLTFYNLDGFGLTYRVGKENALWRFNTGFANGSQSFVSDNVNSSFSAGTSVGREWRKELASKLNFRYGIDLQYNFGINTFYNDNTINTFESNNISHFGGVNLVLGFNYEISNSLFIGAELLPYAGFNYSKNKSKDEFVDQFGLLNVQETESSSYSHRFGIQNNSALISIVYQF